MELHYTGNKTIFAIIINIIYVICAQGDIISTNIVSLWLYLQIFICIITLPEPIGDVNSSIFFCERHNTIVIYLPLIVRALLLLSFHLLVVL